MKKIFSCMACCIFVSGAMFTQAQPWKNPLLIRPSTDGINFGPPQVFQDSSGVPSAIRWHGDTLIAAFQWFRLPNPSPTWDRVAVKFSYNNGLNWTQPQPIIVNGLPPAYQRPFDPTLVVANGDSLRIYFSSGDGLPPMGLDSSVNTYSAISADGVNYYFEPIARVDVFDKQVIDPAVIWFNNAWHYSAPKGAPQDGAHHYSSADGLNFLPMAPVPSDNVHNWTGNYLIDQPGMLRFYGSSPNGIWLNNSTDAALWTGYVNTNVPGGDPTVVKTGPANYMMIYVGPPYPTAVGETEAETRLQFYPNPLCTGRLQVLAVPELYGKKLHLISCTGIVVKQFTLDQARMQMDLTDLAAGTYVLRVEGLVTSQILVLK